MENTYFFILNPSAGGGKAVKRWPKIKALLQEEGHRFEMAESEAAGHATELVAKAVKKGYRNIIAVGGDGTGHEVANGILNQRICPSTDICFGVLPVGTGNDWIKTYGISKDWKKAWSVIAAGKKRIQDVGLVHYQKEGIPQQRYFINVAGLFYDAIVTRASNRPRKGNRKKTAIYYKYLIVKCLFQYQSMKACVRFDGQEVRDSFYSLNVGIGIYNGGGAQFVPQAVPDDGRFALTLIRSVPKWQVIWNTPRIYNGTLDKHSRVDMIHADYVTIESEETEAIPVEADGEFLGYGPVRFELMAQALPVFVP